MRKNRLILYFLILLILAVVIGLWEFNLVRGPKIHRSALRKRVIINDPGWVEYKNFNKSYSIFIPETWKISYGIRKHRRNPVFFYPEENNEDKVFIVEAKTRFEAEKILETGLKDGIIKETPKVAKIYEDDVRVFSETKDNVNYSVYYTVGDRIFRFYVEMPKNDPDFLAQYYKVLTTFKPYF
ncbi:MAG: hypothetical protein KKB81_05095 [Candidatus Margulisbacteria bacterium]|nr:hypothetical protein [Candidatus Margulisiibacteriota bacterium]MBU1021365.1 hypothetical protein [Candidatus Margulisiibacteriota bacterium]MBU1729146.1 hypothetical protein [Candidatus Margulisiibacteriota bacterium]MBU1954819.1 hypothetical protein [Candidatus Margulisiibacteriota bacterium]